jgi:hypothetical protein
MMEGLTSDFDIATDLLVVTAPPVGLALKPWSEGLKYGFKAIGHVYDATQGEFSVG